MSTKPVCAPAKKLTQERFVNLFSTEISREKGNSSWVFASRKKEPGASITQADAVVIAAIIQQSDEPRLVITREFRVPLQTYEISLPSGLVDPGESPSQAALREFKEETGLTLGKIVHVSPPVASSAGLTDETIAYVYGEASGSVSRAFQTEHEDIEVRLLSIADIRRLLASAQGDIISSRLYPMLVSYSGTGVIALPGN
jgi:ADP-ribose pyrophosphatase